MTIDWRRIRLSHLMLAVIFAAGLYATVLRFTRGLGASTNLSDKFPWGLWIGFDVLCGVMLAAGGFTLMAAVHIFNAQLLAQYCDEAAPIVGLIVQRRRRE